MRAPEHDRPCRWWALAAEVRTVADEMTDAEARQIMLKIAECYERLARRALRGGTARLSESWVAADGLGTYGTEK